MNREQARKNIGVRYKPWNAYGVVLTRPDEKDHVMVCLERGRGTYRFPLTDLMLSPLPLRDDSELILVIEQEMKFVAAHGLTDSEKLGLIRYFEEAYGNTDQDTVVYAPEFVIVVRSILAGKRPVKLRYLTDFDGEEK